MTTQQCESVAGRASEMLARAGIVLTREESARFEVADFGLGELEKTGLEIITYVNTDRVCAKEQAGPGGAIISEFSTRSTDDQDVFTDPRIKRMPEIAQA